VVNALWDRGAIDPPRSFFPKSANLPQSLKKKCSRIAQVASRRPEANLLADPWRRTRLFLWTSWRAGVPAEFTPVRLFFIPYPWEIFLAAGLAVGYRFSRKEPRGQGG